MTCASSKRFNTKFHRNYGAVPTWFPFNSMQVHVRSWAKTNGGYGLVQIARQYAGTELVPYFRDHNQRKSLPHRPCLNLRHRIPCQRVCRNIAVCPGINNDLFQPETKSPIKEGFRKFQFDSSLRLPTVHPGYRIDVIGDHNMDNAFS